MHFLKKVVCILLIVALVAGGFILGLRWFLQPDYDLLSSVEIGIYGSMLPVDTTYSISLEAGQWIAVYEKSEWFQVTEHEEKKLSTETVSLLKEVLEENWVCIWDDTAWFYNELGAITTDACTFRFHASFIDGSEIDVEIYAESPKNFDTVFNAFANLF